MLEVDTFPSDSRLKCFEFAVFFLILGIFWGLLATLSMIHHPNEKIRDNAPAKHQLAKPEPIGPMLNGNLCAT